MSTRPQTATPFTLSSKPFPLRLSSTMAAPTTADLFAFSIGDQNPEHILGLVVKELLLRTNMYEPVVHLDEQVFD